MEEGCSFFFQKKSVYDEEEEPWSTAAKIPFYTTIPGLHNFMSN